MCLLNVKYYPAQTLLHRPRMPGKSFYCWHVVWLLVTHAWGWYAGCGEVAVLCVREVRTNRQLMTDTAARNTR